MEDYRVEKDSLGEVMVPQNKYWGAQTQRALENFNISEERMPSSLITSLAILKKAAAVVNKNHGKIPANVADAIVSAADEVIDGKMSDQFPLVVWQTGSGTQTNMNMNEVLSNRSNELLGAKKGSKSPVHPNDHVNYGQSSNDCFPTAMHIDTAMAIAFKLLPNLAYLSSELRLKEKEFEGIVKIGRTHLQDATPITVGQEFSAFAHQVERSESRIKQTIAGVCQLAQGATAVGTGLNSYKGFAENVANELSSVLHMEFKPNPNLFDALSSHDAMVDVSSALNCTAVALMKISNDIRLLSSGPRCGLGELMLPANEPGSSIMPGKVNPTQCEALSMVCAEVMGNHFSVTIAGSHGHLQLNVFKPAIAWNVSRSIRLLTDASKSFAEKCVSGITVNKVCVEDYVRRSLMNVTALNPYIGYDKSCEIAMNAHNKGMTLKESALSLGYVSEENFDRWVNAQKMTML